MLKVILQKAEMLLFLVQLQQSTANNPVTHSPPVSATILFRILPNKVFQLSHILSAILTEVHIFVYQYMKHLRQFLKRNLCKLNDVNKNARVPDTLKEEISHIPDRSAKTINFGLQQVEQKDQLHFLQPPLRFKYLTQISLLYDLPFPLEEQYHRQQLAGKKGILSQKISTVNLGKVLNQLLSSILLFSVVEVQDDPQINRPSTFLHQFHIVYRDNVELVLQFIFRRDVLHVAESHLIGTVGQQKSLSPLLLTLVLFGQRQEFVPRKVEYFGRKTLQIKRLLGNKSTAQHRRNPLPQITNFPPILTLWLSYRQLTVVLAKINCYSSVDEVVKGQEHQCSLTSLFIKPSKSSLLDEFRQFLNKPALKQCRKQILRKGHVLNSIVRLIRRRRVFCNCLSLQIAPIRNLLCDGVKWQQIRLLTCLGKMIELHGRLRLVLQFIGNHLCLQIIIIDLIEIEFPVLLCSLFGLLDDWLFIGIRVKVVQSSWLMSAHVQMQQIIESTSI